MGEVAVPQSTVASQPALQWVRMFTGSPGFLRAAISRMSDEPVDPDHPVRLHILVADRGGLGEGGLGAVGLGQPRERRAHLVERPAQVDRGGAGGVEDVVGAGERGVGGSRAISRATP
jgi:hypothetical protein